MKFGKMLLVALLCGLFLLLLSALVVAPETETVLQENLPLTGLEMSACALPVWADAGTVRPAGFGCWRRCFSAHRCACCPVWF